MPQATLTLLPVELIEEIISYLFDSVPSRPSLTPWWRLWAPVNLEDVMNLRLACRQLDAKVKNRFYNKVVFNKRWCYDNDGTKCEFDVGSFEGLLLFNAVSKVSAFSASMDELDLYCGIVNDYGLKLSADGCASCDKMVLDLDTDDPSNWGTDKPFTKMCAHVLYQDVLYKEKWARAATNYDEDFLEAPFSRGMTNLKKIRLGDVEDWKLGNTTELKELDPNVKRFRSLPQQLCEYEHETLSRATSTIIRGLAKNSIDLETLVVQQSSLQHPNVDKGAAGMWVLDQPTEILQAFKVRKLRLQLSNGTKGPTPAGWTKTRGYKVLLHALDLLPNVEVFSLAPPKYEVLEPDFTSALLQRLPQRVKRFFLHDFIAHSDSLRTFISQRNASLHTLAFTSAHLFADDEDWQPLLQLLHDRTPTIPDLRIGFLYELSPTGYRLLSFPSLRNHVHWLWGDDKYAPHGYTGVFFDGEWRPTCCGSSRHYLRLGDSEEGRLDDDAPRTRLHGFEEERPLPVRAGLAHVLANIHLETYMWADRRPGGVCYASVHLPLQHELWVMRRWGLPEPDYSAAMDAEGVDDWEDRAPRVIDVRGVLLNWRGNTFVDSHY